MRTTMGGIVAVAAFALMGILIGEASAKTVVVKKGGDLQAAIDGAAAGDTVLVKPGTYAPIVLDGRADLTIRGVGKAVVNGASAQNCVLLTNCNRIVVRGLTLKDSQGSALLATGQPGQPSEELTVTRCTVLNAGDEGMEFSSCFKVLVDRNTIDTTEDDGIALSDGSNDPSRVSVISKNKIRHASDGGIDINGNDNVISGNQIRDSGEIGVLIQSGFRNIVEKNKIMNVDGAGIDVRGDAGAVRSNVLVKPTGDGIIVRSQLVEVSKNVVVKAGSSGIRVTGTSNQVTNNVITKSGGVADLQDSSGGTTNTYKGNKAKTLSPSDLSNPKK